MATSKGKSLYLLLLVSLEAIFFVTAALLIQNEVLGDTDTCVDASHGCAKKETTVPCSTTYPCASYFGLLKMEDINCDNSWDVCDDQTIPGYYTSSATSAWYTCLLISNPKAAACDSACLTCANVDLYYLGCTVLDKCATGALKRCGAAVGNPCN